VISMVARQIKILYELSSVHFYSDDLHTEPPITVHPQNLPLSLNLPNQSAPNSRHHCNFKTTHQMTHSSPVKFTQLCSPAMAVSVTTPFSVRGRRNGHDIEVACGLKESRHRTNINEETGKMKLHVQRMIGLDCGGY